MDRNDSNPGMIERQLDDAPMQGSPTEREDMERGSQPEREGMQGEGMERDSMRGEGTERESLTDRPVDGGSTARDW